MPTDTHVSPGVTRTIRVATISTATPNTPKPIRPTSVFSMNG